MVYRRRRSDARLTPQRRPSRRHQRLPPRRLPHRCPRSLSEEQASTALALPANIAYQHPVMHTASRMGLAPCCWSARTAAPPHVSTGVEARWRRVGKWLWWCGVEGGVCLLPSPHALPDFRWILPRVGPACSSYASRVNVDAFARLHQDQHRRPSARPPAQRQPRRRAQLRYTHPACQRLLHDATVCTADAAVWPLCAAVGLLYCRCRHRACLRDLPECRRPHRPSCLVHASLL